MDISDEPERVMEALSSSIWPGAKMKNSSSRTPLVEQNQNLSRNRMDEVLEMGSMRDELDHLSALEDSEDQNFGALLTLVNQVRSQAEVKNVLEFLGSFLGAFLVFFMEKNIRDHMLSYEIICYNICSKIPKSIYYVFYVNICLYYVFDLWSQGQNLSDSERRANAEQMISAIYTMLGSDSDSPDSD